MNDCFRPIFALLLPVALAGPPALRAEDGAATPILARIRVVQGQNAVHTAGARSAPVLTVEVTDETGKPVEGAAVSFRIPATGPGGLFPNGLTSDVVLTDARGRAAAGGVRWNRIPGPFQIRVTTVKGTARAGLAVPAYLADKPSDPAAKTTEPPGLPNPRRKWLMVAVIAGGVMAGSVAVGLVRRPGAATAAAAQSGTALSVGPPTVTIGGPQ